MRKDKSGTYYLAHWDWVHAVQLVQLAVPVLASIAGRNSGQVDSSE